MFHAVQAITVAPVAIPVPSFGTLVTSFSTLGYNLVSFFQSLFS